MNEYLSLYITAPSFEVADKIGRAMIEERLAACVNIIPGMHSGTVNLAGLAALARTDRGE